MSGPGFPEYYSHQNVLAPTRARWAQPGRAWLPAGSSDCTLPAIAIFIAIAIPADGREQRVVTPGLHCQVSAGDPPGHCKQLGANFTL